MTGGGLVGSPRADGALPAADPDVTSTGVLIERRVCVFRLTA